MSFKDIIQDDLATFLNVNEFADLHTFLLENVTYSIPTIVQDEITDKYEKNYDGAYSSIIDVVFRASDVLRVPVYNQTIVFDDATYWILKSETVFGMATLRLGAPEV